VRPYFKQHEDQWALDPDALDPGSFERIHARGGEWRVELARIRWEILDAFRAAAAEAGVPKVDDFNGGNNEGCGYFHVNQRTGVRWNTSKAFLRPVKHRRNLTIETQALVERLTLDGKRVTGLVFNQGGQRRTLTARCEVILCAGAIGSPQILQLSGIGAGAMLKRLGIAVTHELRGVGENLQDHLQIRCAFKVEGARTMNERFQSILQRAGFVAQYALTRRGPMTMAPSQLGAFVKSDPSRDTPDLQYHVQPLTLPKFGEPLDPFPAFTASVANLRPTSRGSVRITSADPAQHPEIRPNYLSTEDDRRVAAAAVRITRRIVSMPALTKYRPQEFRPGLEFASDAELAQAAGDISTTIFHPVGTAKMGNDEAAVVDHCLKVRGLQGLRVADASVMPTITSGNTNAPTLMIAEKAAAMILADTHGHAAAGVTAS